jgi:hypothetical protein
MVLPLLGNARRRLVAAGRDVGRVARARLEIIRHMICPSHKQEHLGGVSLAARPPQEDVGTAT